MSHWKQLYHLVLDEAQWEYARSSGPGGQNVNKVETKSVLRWSAGASKIPLPDLEKIRFHIGRLLTKSEELIIASDRFRDRERNRSDVQEKLFEVFEKNFFVPPTRKKTKPTKASKRKRLDSKSRRKDTKSNRSKVSW